ISPYRHRFFNYRDITPPRPITAANGDTFDAVGEGDMEVCVLNTNGQPTTITLRDVLYAPNIGFSLVSIRKADEAGYSAIFAHGECQL
ncbi:uncharacterized protein BXZ73DRAFT_30373, partial [Epithele typhae]|uniref:uncharacterized protein n=1 Tax=Epithele typhae TaxID=378194 RepID=UPI002008C2F7